MQNDIPEPLQSPAAWIGADMTAQPDRWLEYLSRDEIAELEAAAKRFLDTTRDLATLVKADFHLPQLASRLAKLKQTLLQGVGVQVLRGLQPARYSQRKIATIFYGIGAHLGHARSQNADGHLLGHVRNTGADSRNVKTRIYQTAERQTFHTDSSDVVCLLCLNDAQAGGESLLVSSITLFNELRARHPELLSKLFEPVATDRRGEVPDGDKPYFTIPVFNWHADKLSTIYQRQYIDSAQRFADAPRLSKNHVAALDLFDAIANDSRFHFSMRLEPGDMQFVYNHNLLHDRNAFSDWPDPARQRHLLRLWLSIPDDRPLPDCFAQRFGSTQPGNRGGVAVSGTQYKVPLDD